jgi:prepilin-type processing-associated H-X9-DG protein
MIGDCEWYGAIPLDLASGSLGGAVPKVENALYKQFYGANMWQYDMARFAMNRHGRAINMCFEDGSVRRVDKNELWTLNWYRGFRPAKVTVPF